eukprot:gene12715-6913_t
MNTSLPQGFQVPKNVGLIHQSENSHVFKGEFKEKEAILKHFPFAYPSEAVQLSYQQDHHIGQLLHEKYPGNFSEPLEFVHEPNMLYLIKSYEGSSLSEYINDHGRMDIKTFIITAIEICQNLHLIHEQNIVHCDIKPQNILYNEKTNKMVVIDFESSFLVSLKNPTVPKAERDEAKEIYQELIKNSKTNFESLKATVSYSKLLLLAANFHEAIKLIFELFSKYDVSKDMPKENNEAFSKWSTNLLNELLQFFKGKESGKLFLESIPETADQEWSLLSRFLLNSSAVFYQVAQSHFATATQLMGVKLAIQHGNNEYLPPLLASLSWHAQFHFQKSSPAVFGKVSQDLTKYITSPNIRLYSSFYTGLSAMFDGNCQTAIKFTANAYTYGFSIGEFNWGSYSCYCWMNFNIANGCNFSTLYNKSTAAQKAVYNAKHPFIGDMMASSIQTMSIITEKSTTFEPIHFIPGFINFPFGRYNLYSQKAISLYLLQDYNGAREALDTLKEFPKENIGLPHFYDDSLYSMLIDFHIYEQWKDDSIIDRMKESLNILKSYSDQNPIYFKSRHLFGEGILKLITKNRTETDEFTTFSYLDKAVKNAAANGSTWIEAMATEFFADFCSNTEIFNEYSKYLYLQAFSKWQTMGVVIRCNKLKSYARRMSFTGSIGTTSSSSETTTGNVFGIDIQTIIKSSNTVSEDLDKKKLLTKLNQVIVENAGATRGFIILKSNDEKYTVESEFSDDKKQSNHCSKSIEGNCNFLSFQI